MAGKKATPVKPAPPSTQRSGSATPSSKGRRKQASAEASAASAKARSAPRSRKITEKPAAAKKKRDRAGPQEGGKRKKQRASGDAARPAKKRKKGDGQQASADAATPAKKRKKGAGPDPKPQKEPKPAKKQQPSGKQEKPMTPLKKQQSPGKPAKAATPAKKQQSPSNPAKAATPAKKQSAGKSEKPTSTRKKQQQSPGKARKSVAPATKKKQAKREKPTPTKRKRGDDESQKEPRSPKRASGDGEAPVKKKRKDQKAAAADMVACSFPMARVRQVMRAEDATIRASSEAVFIINKASEFFLGKFAEDAYRNALKDRKKSTTYDNLSTAVCNQKRLKFLSDFIPQRVRAEDALKSSPHGGQPISQFKPWTLAHKGKTTSDIDFNSKDPPSAYINTSVHSRLNDYTSMAREVHGPNYNPTTKALGGELVVRVGGGKKHGRYWIGDNVLDTASAPTLSQVQARSTSSSPAIRPQPDTAKSQIEALQAQLEEERKRWDEMKARMEAERQRMEQMVLYMQTLAQSMGYPVPPMLFPPIPPTTTPIESAASNVMAHDPECSPSLPPQP